jgi:hypothetical protein
VGTDARGAGVYLPRYRCFNIMGTGAGAAGGASYPVLAETFGGLFRCYPPKIAPKLPASTELTNYLAKMGLSVNLRGEDDRPARGRGKKRPDEEASSSTGKRKVTEETHEQDDGDDDDESE